MATRVIIVGGGFAGLNAAKQLGNVSGIEVTLLDRRNHHLFQPLLYQVATAGLSPADIAAPIRNVLSRYKNIRVLLAEVTNVDLSGRVVNTDIGDYSFDYLLLACGANHSYFGRDEWAEFAPGLKTIEGATEIRRRVLTAFETAEASTDQDEQKKQMTFVIVGGGPTGVEMAGAIGEMSRFTLAKDFRSINAKSARVILMESGPRVLSAFPAELSDRAASDLEKLGVQVWTGSVVSAVDSDGVTVGSERIQAATVIWAAGVQASSLGKKLNVETDRQGRIKVNPDLSLPNHERVFIAGDQAHVATDDGRGLPGLAPVAIQQGRFFGKLVIGELAAKPRTDFKYHDKGIMATVGRNKAVVETGGWKFGGRLAWLTWLVVHIYFLTGFRNRFFVVLSWAWSYLTFRRGARLIVGSRDPSKRSSPIPARSEV